MRRGELGGIDGTRLSVFAGGTSSSVSFHHRLSRLDPFSSPPPTYAKLGATSEKAKRQTFPYIHMLIFWVGENLLEPRSLIPIPFPLWMNEGISVCRSVASFHIFKKD